MTQKLHRISLCLMAGYLLALILIVFWPTPVDRPATGLLDDVIGWMHRHGVPKSIGYTQIEFSANIALFVPMGIAASTWFKNAWLGLILACLASCLIELVQLLVLADRFASGLDVIANTTGAAIGAAFYCFAHKHHARRLTADSTMIGR